MTWKMLKIKAVLNIEKVSFYSLNTTPPTSQTVKDSTILKLLISWPPLYIYIYTYIYTSLCLCKAWHARDLVCILVGSVNASL